MITPLSTRLLTHAESMQSEGFYTTANALAEAAEVLKQPSDIVSGIALAIDKWRVEHPDIAVSDVLLALEEIRFKLTETLIRQ